MQRILGIDPGLRMTGYGAVVLRDGAHDPALVEAGVIRLDADTSMEQRLAQLEGEMDQIIDRLQPTCLVVEKLYAHYRHPRTAILMAHARGVILLGAARRGVCVEHLPATEVKKAVTGYGHASKQQMQLAVASQLRLTKPPHPPDVADAIAIALTHARRVVVARL